MKYKVLGLLILLLIVMSANSEAQIIYVDNSQPGAGDGSFAQPFQTINEAVAAASANDTIMLRAGTYREQVIVKKSGLSILPYNNEVVTMSGAEPLLNWELVEGTIYKTIMNWNVTEGGQSNQVFLDGKMIYEARWPKMTGDDMTYMPDNAKAKDVKQNILLGNLKYRDLLYDAFSETAGRWDGAQVWINLSHNGNDGQGWTGDVVKTDPVKHIITIDGRGLKIEESPWGLGPNTEFYLFSPKPSSVYSTGGVAGILGKGEWWKNGDTLWVNLPNDLPPAGNELSTNLIEAKKRIYAFSPDPLLLTISGLKISKMSFFACSLTTDINAANRPDYAANARNNVIDSIDAKYITHFIDQRGDYQKQWAAKSGFIISGYNNTVKNCTFAYSAASAISLVGKNNKIWNNTIHDVNYSVSESGAINTGQNGSQCIDNEIAFNTIYNIPEQGIDIQQFSNSDPNKPGLGRIHHNIIHDFMIRTHDSGGLDGFGKEAKWVRYDHNIFYNSTNFLAIGIYTDFGGEQLIDHNLFWNIERPVQMNQNSAVGYWPIKVYNNTAIADAFSKPGIFNGVGTWGPSFDVRNNIMSGTIPAGPSGSVVRSNIPVLSLASQSSLFTDPATNDYTLKSTAMDAIDKGEYTPFAFPLSGVPDLGCYESGAEPWKAGAGNFKPEFVLVDSVNTLIIKSAQVKTWKFPVHAISYCGFSGDVSLSLGELSSGITALLSAASIPANGSCELTITANNLSTPLETIVLTGICGEYSYVRTYAVTILPMLTSVEISPALSDAKLGEVIQFTALAKDQFGSAMNPAPVITWSIAGGGTISAGKFKATTVSDKVTIIASSQGISDTLELKVTDPNVGIYDPDIEFNSIYPNPAGDELSLRIHAQKNERITINIYNGISEICINKQWNLNAGENKETINVSDLPKGLYLIRISSGTRTLRLFQKFIKN
jgi:hypothetical protein